MARKRSRFINKERPSRFLPAKFRKDKDLSGRPRPMSARSSVRSSVYTPRAYDDDYLYVPFRPVYSSYGRYDSSGEENASRSQVNRELIMSTAAMEDNYDLSLRSRNRDKDVLAAANRAITPPPTAALNMDSRGVSATPRRSTLRRSQSARSLRSHSVPPIRPTYITSNSGALVPADTTTLKASIAPKPSHYLRYSKAIDTAKSLREGTYTPMYSSSVRTSVSPSRERSFSLMRSESPIRSPSPVGRESPDRNGRMLQKRRRPRVLANKRRVGNYYNRLLSRRESDGRDCKYWPYLDVDEIETTDLGDFCSDTEDNNETYSGDTYYLQSNRNREYDDNEEDAAPVRYVYEYETDIPDEYVPFRPKVRYRSPDRDYSKMSVIPFLPHRDPTRTSVADTISFNAIVAESAARARQALERINWDNYDSAGLVLSVEGEYHSPENEVPLGFRYVSRPIALKVAAVDRVSAYDSDNAFSKYWTDLQKFRESIRLRLEEGYKALSSSTKSYTPALTSYTPPPFSSSSALTSYSSRPSRKSYYKRLRDDKDYKYGQSLELYPLESSRGTSATRRALPSSDDALPESRALSVYDSKTDSDSRMSVLAKVKIKVDTELHSSPRSAVAARRVMRGQSTPPQSTVYSKTEAALIGSRVDVVSPDKGYRRRPRSAYAQAKIRQLDSDKRTRDVSPVVAAEHTTELKASRPVYTPNLIKPIHDVDGVKKPSNILSWQYKLDAITSPDDFIIVPRSLSSVKAQLREAQDKMVKHRQLMDRYLDADTGLSMDDKMA